MADVNQQSVVGSYQRAQAEIKARQDQGKRSIIDADNPDNSLNLGDDNAINNSDGAREDHLVEKDTLADDLQADRPNIQSAADYKVDEIKLPNGMTADRETDKDFLEFAFGKSWSNEDVNAVRGWYYKMLSDNLKHKEQAMRDFKEQSVTELRRKFGNKYELKVETASAVAKKLGGPGFASMLKNTGLDSHYEMILFLNQVGERLHVTPSMYMENDMQESASDDLAFVGDQVASRVATSQKDTASGEAFAAKRAKIEKAMRDPRYGKDENYSNRVSQMWRELYPNK